jgi:hypothetical protein
MTVIRYRKRVMTFNLKYFAIWQEATMRTDQSSTHGDVRACVILSLQMECESECFIISGEYSI